MLKREEINSVTILILNSRQLKKNVKVHQKEALVRKMGCLSLAKASPGLRSQTAMVFFSDSSESDFM